MLTNANSSSGGDNSSDTESAPSPSQADSSKSGDGKRVEAAAGDVQSSDMDKGPVASAKAPEPSYGELRVKEEKSPESEAGSQEARPTSFSDSVHPKPEPQDVDMKSGEVQVKMEPGVKERGEKADHGGREHHSDNDSSATCSADEDVEAESETRFVFRVVTVAVRKGEMCLSLTFSPVPQQDILNGEALSAQPSRLGAGSLPQANPT